VSEHKILKYKGIKLFFFISWGEGEEIIIFPVFFPEIMCFFKKKVPASFPPTHFFWFYPFRFLVEIK